MRSKRIISKRKPFQRLKRIHDLSPRCLSDEWKSNTGVASLITVSSTLRYSHEYKVECILHFHGIFLLRFPRRNLESWTPRHGIYKSVFFYFFLRFYSVSRSLQIFPRLSPFTFSFLFAQRYRSMLWRTWTFAIAIFPLLSPRAILVLKINRRFYARDKTHSRAQDSFVLSLVFQKTIKRKEQSRSLRIRLHTRYNKIRIHECHSAALSRLLLFFVFLFLRFLSPIAFFSSKKDAHLVSSCSPLYRSPLRYHPCPPLLDSPRIYIIIYKMKIVLSVLW